MTTTKRLFQALCAMVAGGCIAGAMPEGTPVKVFPGSQVDYLTLGTVLADLQVNHYPECQVSAITPLELVDISPETIKAKKSLDTGDAWSEQWRLDACGAVNVHTINFKLVEIGGPGLIGLSMNVKAAQQTP